MSRKIDQVLFRFQKNERGTQLDILKVTGETQAGETQNRWNSEQVKLRQVKLRQVKLRTSHPLSPRVLSYKVMSFGLRNMFQRLMNLVVAGLDGFAFELDLYCYIGSQPGSVFNCLTMVQLTVHLASVAVQRYLLLAKKKRPLLIARVGGAGLLFFYFTFQRW